MKGLRAMILSRVDLLLWCIGYMGGGCHVMRDASVSSKESPLSGSYTIAVKESANTHFIKSYAVLSKEQ